MLYGALAEQAMGDARIGLERAAALGQFAARDPCGAGDREHGSGNEQGEQSARRLHEVGVEVEAKGLVGVRGWRHVASGDAVPCYRTRAGRPWTGEPWL
ncbi:hypothetical protein BH09PSE5_BH09PSE5_07250 [soil metagenome]